MRDYALARATERSTWRSRATHSPCKRSTPRVSTSKTGATLKHSIRVFAGGPTGVEALAATMNVAVDTLRDEVEPYLLRREFLVRSPAAARSRCRLRAPEPAAPPPDPEDLPFFDPRSAGCSSERSAEESTRDQLLRSESGRRARIRRSRTACHSGSSGGAPQ